MKTYYFTEEKRQAKFGLKVIQRVYKIEKGGCPTLLAIHEYNTGSCMGDTSEAFQGLVNAGILPNKYKYKYSTDIPHKMYKL